MPRKKKRRTSNIIIDAIFQEIEKGEHVLSNDLCFNLKLSHSDLVAWMAFIKKIQDAPKIEVKEFGNRTKRFLYSFRHD